MTVEYRIAWMGDAFKAGYPGVTEDDIDYDEWFSGLWRFEDGKPVELLGTDGGEPEDQTLGRDWSWVAGALSDAYRLGRESA